MSAHDIDSAILFSFFNTMFPQKKALPNIWKWQNRSSFHNKKAPIVALYRDRIVGYNGIIPFYICLDGKKYTAQFSIDLGVLPQYRRNGIASLLKKELTKFSDLHFGFPNEDAISLSKKQGRAEAQGKSYLHYFNLLPLSHPYFAGKVPKIGQRVFNTLLSLFLRGIYKRFAFEPEQMKFDPINLDSLRKFSLTKSTFKKVAFPLRDSDYMSWRILDSPHNEKYHIFNTHSAYDVSLLIKLCVDNQNKSADILMVSHPYEYNIIRKMISSLALYCLKDGYSYIRFFTSNKQQSDFLQKSLKSIVRRHQLVFYSRDSLLFQKVGQASWHFELIDSDFEKY